jgi:hypothetical protein
LYPSSRVGIGQPRKDNRFKNKKTAAGILSALALIGVIGAVALSSPQTTLVLVFRQSSGCIIQDENGSNLTNMTTTVNNVNPGPGTVVTETYDVVNVGTTALTLSTFTAIDNNGGVAITYSGPIALPTVIQANGQVPVSVIMTMTGNARSLANSTITITAVCQ